MAQINPRIGDIENNLRKIKDYIDKASATGCDIVIFPELSIPGYPPRDLLLRQDFIAKCIDATHEIASYSKDTAVLFGNISPSDDNKLYNSAFLAHNGEIIAKVNKSLLPNYDVFEEARYFKPAESISCVDFKGVKLGISICEDIWNDGAFVENKRYTCDVLGDLNKQNPDIFLNLSASPYYYKKLGERIDMLKNISQKYSIPFVYVNQIGGNDELIFDGTSMAFDKDGRLVTVLKCFDEDFCVYDTEAEYKETIDVVEDIDWLYKALVTGIRDYYHKTGFEKAVIGLSGGIDSTLMACLAVDALGSENVLGISNPSRYSSDHSKTDAAKLAANLGVELKTIAIESIFSAYLSVMNEDDNLVGDLAEENVQARIRGDIWMFISNRENRLVLTNGNKSEIAVGYCTLYGDMCGALAAIGDVKKTQVYDLCRHINRNGEIVPENILIKAPSAELAPGQTDQDSLPPYDILDKVLTMYIEEETPVEAIVDAMGDRELVYKILNMIDRSEFKRRQAAPVLKVTPKSFGMGRRIPIAQGFKWSK